MKRSMCVPLMGGAALLAGCGPNVTGPVSPPLAAELTIVAEKLPPQSARGHCGLRFDGSESCTYYVYVRVVVAEHAGGGAQLNLVELEMRNRVTGRSEAFGMPSAPRDLPGAGRVPPFGALTLVGRADYTFEVYEPWETRDLIIRGHLTDDAGTNHTLVTELSNIR